MRLRIIICKGTAYNENLEVYRALLRQYFKIKLELNLKKVELECCKIFYLCLFISFFALKARLQELQVVR